jgi:hypothetical protein
VHTALHCKVRPMIPSRLPAAQTFLAAPHVMKNPACTKAAHVRSGGHSTKKQNGPSQPHLCGAHHQQRLLAAEVQALRVIRHVNHARPAEREPQKSQGA